MTTVQFRIDDDLKREATAVYEELGLDLSSAIRMFLKRSVSVRGIPFPTVLEPAVPPSGTEITQALSVLADCARENGSSGLSLEEINQEIAATRHARARK